MTANPPASTGDATQTIPNVTFTAGAAATENFTVASGASVGSLVGTVTNAAGTPISGVTVTVTGNNYKAIVQTGPLFNAPPSPNGDGLPANYDIVLPGSTAGITYTVVYSLPGFTSGQQNELVKSAAPTRANFTLTSIGTAGQNTAVVINATTQATTQGQTVTTPTGSQTVNPGAIVINFPDPNSIVQGIEVLADSSPQTSSGFGGFNAAQANTGPQGLTAIGGDGQVTLTFQSPSSGLPPDSFNIFRSTVTRNSVTRVNQPGAGAGTEGNVPFFTGVPFTPGQNTTTFVDTNVTNGTEYFYQVTAVSTEKITPEGLPISSAGGVVPNAAIKLNTDDNAGQTSAAGNIYDDVYPTWSPFLSIFNIAYQSGGYNPVTGVVNNGRTVTYNDPTTSFPSEVAISVPNGGTVNGTASSGGYSVGGSYSGILQSQVLNLDPPTLLRFSDTEIVHVQPVGPDPVNGVPTKIGINPGQQVTFTVRLSDREAGIDNGNDSALFPTGPHTDATKPQVFLQIKDPDSKYQDAQRLEHKVFAKDSQFNFQANRPQNEFDSGTPNRLLPITGNDGTTMSDYPTFPTFPPPTEYVLPRGARGGLYGTTGSHVYIGRSGGGTNQTMVTGAKGANSFVPGPDPNLFIPWGPEYECQFINPAFAMSSGQLAPSDASPTDYGSPYYLAGVDDNRPFSGQGRERPTINFTDNQGQARPAEWLQMNISPVQDHLGGVLYTVTWTTPASGSDFYLDVIAFDKAIFPNFPPGTSAFSGGKVNWRIYDNVGGFSTNASIGNNDILVVSDYALGQKFAGATFAGINGNLNLVPKIYGTESYYTDVDVNILPNVISAGFPTNPSAPFNFVPYLQSYLSGMPYRNGLGVGSYFDSTINDGGTVDGAPFNTSQKYSIWRILARGPIPQSVLNSYLPTKQPQPAVIDTQDPSGKFKNVPSATVLDAHRCVVWLSPYTGDLLTDPGALDDPGAFNRPNAPDRQSTQTILRNFVQNGGRLFLTGQDVGSALTLGGTVGNAAGGFLSDVMNATLASTGGGTTQLAATDNRITGNPLYDHSAGYPRLQYPQVVGDYPPAAFSDGFPGSFFPYQDHLELGDQTLSDGSLSQRPQLRLPSGASLLGQPDTLTPTNGATTAITYANGAVAMVYHTDDPYKPNADGSAPALPNGGTGSRTVYAGFGLEGLSSDVSAPVGSSTQFPAIIPPASPNNPRPNILHNIVCFLRTGGVSGIITQTAGTGQGAGQGVPGVTVYLVPVTGTAPATRATFSAITASDGHFSIVGVEPGTYTVAAYRPGFARAVSNAGISITVEGDVTGTAALTITPLPPGSIAGQVKDTAGNVVIGATVSFLSKDKTISKSTASFDGRTAGQAAGSYFLPNVPATDYTGAAIGPNNPSGLPEYQPAAAPDPTFDQVVTVQPNTTTQPVNFTLTPILATISGRIFNVKVGDTAAGALGGATVTLTNAAGTVIGAPVTAAADGTYSFTNVPAASTATTYTITATKAGFATTNNTITATVFLGDVLTGKDIGLVPIPPGSLSGTVTNGTTGVAGAMVSFTTGGSATPVTATTLGDGSYTIANVPAGTYTGTAVGPNNPHGRPTATSATPQQAVVQQGANTVVPPFTVTTIPPSFTGTVTSGAPPVGATVTVTDDSTGVVVVTVKAGANGVYTTGPLAPGTYTVTASLAGFTSVSLLGSDPDDTGKTNIVVYNGDALTNQNINLTPVPPGSIFGTVKDTSSNPVPNATVTFVSRDGTVTKTATTDPSGNFMIPPVPPNNVPASAYNGSAVGPNNPGGKPEYQPAAPQTITVASGQGAGPVNFVLTPILPTVTGIVTDSTTKAGIPGATVTFTPVTGTPLTLTTDATGKYATGAIAPGAYTVAVTAAGYITQTTPLTLNLGDVVTQPFTLDEQATLVGLVTDATTSAVLSGVTITIKGSAGAAVTTVPALVTSSAKTTPASDGQPANYQATIDLAGLTPGATYTVTASRANFNSQTQTIVLKQGFNRLDFTMNHALLSSIGTLGGLVTNSTDTVPVSGATVTVRDAGQTIVAQFTTSATVTAAPDGGQLNYTGMLSQGSYTVTVTKGSRTSAAESVTVLGGQFNRLDFNGATGGLPPLHTFAAGLNFLSLPYDYSGSSFDSLFGTINTAPSGTTPNGNRSHVAVWNPALNVYALDPNPPADALRLGVGYWIFLKNPVNVTQQGATPSAATVPVALHPAWNQIGVPNPKGVAVSSLLFDNGAGGTITFAQAASSQYHVVLPTLYRYDGTTYQTVAPTDILQPWQAYWIRVYADATVEIPTK